MGVFLDGCEDNLEEEQDDNLFDTLKSNFRVTPQLRDMLKSVLPSSADIHAMTELKYDDVHVCESGFGSGHFTSMMLLQNSTSVTVFDMFARKHQQNIKNEIFFLSTLEVQAKHTFSQTHFMI